MEKKIVKNLTEREELELIERINKASNEDLGKLAQFTLRLQSDPFDSGRRMLELPSVTREKVIKALTNLIKRGEIPVAKLNQ